MERRVISRALWAVPLLSGALLFLVWRLGKQAASPPRGGASAVRHDGEPRPVTFPPGLLGRIRRDLAGKRFRWLLVYRGGPATPRGWARALERYDLVLAAQEGKAEGPWIRRGRSWENLGERAGRGVFRVAWLGSPSARLRACLVRTLEVLAACLDLPVKAVRLREEMPWARGGKEGGSASPGVDGARLRSWIRGGGAGQGRKGR